MAYPSLILRANTGSGQMETPTRMKISWRFEATNKRGLNGSIPWVEGLREVRRNARPEKQH